MIMHNIKLIKLDGSIIEEIDMTESDVIMGRAADYLYGKYKLRVVKQFDTSAALFKAIVDGLEIEARVFLNGDLLPSNKAIIVEKL